MTTVKYGQCLCDSCIFRGGCSFINVEKEIKSDPKTEAILDCSEYVEE